MLKSYALAAILLVAIPAISQKRKDNNPDLPAFGKVEKADLEMKECNFDEKAEALVLLDEGELEYIDGLELNRRIRIKILSDKGLDRADIHLPYISAKGEESISNIEAQTYNLDESGNVVISKVEKKLIYDKKINKKLSEKAFTFPDVKVGSVIEYRFRHKGVGLIDWYFQRSIPVKYSYFAIDFPVDIQASVLPHCSRQYEFSRKSSGNRESKSYAMRNIPGFRDEPYILNEDFYRERVETKVTAYRQSDGRMSNRVVNWLQVIKFLMEDEDFGIQLKRNIPRTDELDASLKNVTDSYLRMKTIYKYVQENMTWNEYTGIWALDGVRAAWKDKKGTVGEINLILVNLLKDAGLNAHPVLVSTHDNGVVNTADAGTYEHAGFFQFDKVMAYVEIGEKVYVLDASDKTLPVHLMPPDILLTEGLVIEKVETFDWGWRQLWDKDETSSTSINIQGFFNEAGKMNGEVKVTSYDYARLPRLATVKKGKDEYIEKYVSNASSSMTVDDVSFENTDDDSLPLVQKIKFTQSLNSSGDYSYFSTNILSGLEKNPFVADSRFSDVFFGCNQTYVISGSFFLGDNYEVEGLPKNIKMIMPDTSISVSRISQLSGNVLMTRIQLNFNKPFYPVTQYAEFQEFYKLLFDLLNEQYVIRKKNKDNNQSTQ